MDGTNCRVRLLGYARVSTVDQATTGYGLDAQEEAIVQACGQRGWDLSGVRRDEGGSGKSLDRPVLQDALRQIADGNVSGLLVAKLDRLSRSVADFAALLEWFSEAEAVLVALDLGIDTSTPGGRLVANVFASVAEWEREMIGARTRDGLLAARACGKPISGPSVVDNPALLDQIRELRSTGMSLRAIADRLNQEGVPTLRGGVEWRPSSIQAVAGAPRRAARRKAVALPMICPKRRQRLRV